MIDNVIAVPVQATTVQELMPTLRLLIAEVARLSAKIEELENDSQS
jgi:hypothetical protein